MFPLLMVLGMAMFGNVIGYGFSHDSVQLIVVGFTGGIAIMIAFWISVRS